MCDFFFNDTATTEIYTLSLHDALPISSRRPCGVWPVSVGSCRRPPSSTSDRKSTRLNSSHEWISYAVFCLKKKKILGDTQLVGGGTDLPQDDPAGSYAAKYRLRDP